jgi:haloalkane dehalogenase
MSSTERPGVSETTVPDGVHGDTDWVDRVAYPFESRCVALPQGAVHYVDEGPGADHEEDTDGPTLVFLHGNPTWSFCYRHLIRGLRDEYRCVAMDYLGFGLSEHPEGFSYRPSAHADVFEAFVEELGLTDVVLVVQDWGGPIGLSYAADHPENVAGLVVVNTWAWPVDEEWWYRTFSWGAGGPLGRVLCERFNAFVEVVMPAAYGDRSKLTPAIHEQYRRALPAGKREGTWVFPRAIVEETPWLEGLWDRIEGLEDHPALLLWGLEDPAFGAQLPVWETFFRDAETRTFPDAGHYLQEEVGEDLVEPIRVFVAGPCSRGVDSGGT